LSIIGFGIQSSIFPAFRIGTPPPPHPQSSVPPPLWFRGWVHTRLRDRGWGVPIPTRGQTLWYTLGIHVLCAIYVYRYRSILTKKKRLRMKVTYLRQSILHLIEAPASRPPPHCMRMTLKISISAFRSLLRTSTSASRSSLRNQHFGLS
jgi:hypothetical protein